MEDRVRQAYRGARHSLRKGFSLLEIILALAILAGSVAVLSEVARLGLQNARHARDLTHAAMLCESKLAEVAAGIEPMEPQDGVPFETTDDLSEPDWLYTIEVNTVEIEGLLEVRVTVIRDLPPETQPPPVSLVRLMLDPSFEFETSETEDLGTTHASNQ
jgi:type II secretion system protein I